jgi:hypothetical protein
MTSGPGSTGSRVGTGDTPGGPFSGSGSGSGNFGSGSFGGSLADEDGIGAGGKLSSSGSVSPGPGKGGPGKRSDGCDVFISFLPSRLPLIPKNLGFSLLVYAIRFRPIGYDRSITRGTQGFVNRALVRLLNFFFRTEPIVQG